MSKRSAAAATHDKKRTQDVNNRQKNQLSLNESIDTLAQPLETQSPIQRKCACGGFCPKCKKDNVIQAKLRPESLESELEEDAGTSSATEFNRSGLPEPLKQGLESLSGANLSQVKVHYNNEKPAAMNAWAYTQGQNIYLGPGQEKYLPHEGWHAVQQMQGQVQTTQNLNGNALNNSPKLEREADVMGERASQISARPTTTGPDTKASKKFRNKPSNPVARPVVQRAPLKIDTIKIKVAAGSVIVTPKAGDPLTYPLVSEGFKLPMPIRDGDPGYSSGTRIPALHKANSMEDNAKRIFKDEESSAGHYSYSWSMHAVDGQPKLDAFEPGGYHLIFIYSSGGSDVGDGSTDSDGQGEEGEGEGLEGKGEAVEGDGKSDTKGTEDGKPEGTGDSDSKPPEEKLKDFLDQAGGEGDDIDGTPLSDEEKARIAEAIQELSEAEKKQFFRTMEELEVKCENDPACPGKSLADLIEFFENLSEPDREALSINQMLKADPNTEATELPEEIMLNIAADAADTADAGKKVEGINKNLALMQSKITDPSLKKDLEPLDPNKLSELSTMLMIQGMLRGAGERLPPLLAVAQELSLNISNIRSFIFKEIAWLSAEIAASMLFAALLAPLSAGTSTIAGAAVVGVLALRLNKLRILINKLQALADVISTIQGLIGTFEKIRDTLEKSDDILAQFEEKRAKIQELQSKLNKSELTPDMVLQLEDAEDELLAMVLGTEDKPGLIDKFKPIMDKFFLPDELTDEELKQLIYDVPDGVEAMESALAYRNQIKSSGSADQTVTLSLKGFRAGYLLAPFVGFLTGVINKKLGEIMADKDLTERLLGFGGRKGRGGKFKGSKKKPKNRLKATKTNKQKRDEAAKKKKAPETEADKKKKDKEKDKKALTDSTASKWAAMSAEIRAMAKQAQDQGGLTKTDVKKKVTNIVGKADYKIFNAKHSIENYAKDPAMNRIKIEDRNTTPSKAKPGAKKKPKKPKHNKDILTNYVRSETKRHKSINAAIRERFKNWSDDKSDTKDEIVKVLDKLKKEQAYPLHFRYPDAAKKETGKVIVEAEEVSGDIIAWKIMTSLGSAKAAEVIRLKRPGSYWGSEKNPVMLDWKKPAINNAVHYEPLYIGPYVAGEIRLTQAELKATKSKNKKDRQSYADGVAARITKTSVKDKVLEWKKDPVIKKYDATDSPTRLPKPSVSSLGVIPKWQAKTGKKIPFKSQARGNAAGATITNKIKLFGFFASEERKDGDHVWEIQVGGPDKIENMWPLESGLNQTAGGELERATVKDDDNKTVTMKNLKALARTNAADGKEMWIKIKSVK
jgi:hypothetical protein